MTFEEFLASVFAVAQELDEKGIPYTDIYVAASLSSYGTYMEPGRLDLDTVESTEIKPQGVEFGEYFVLLPIG